MKTKYFLLTFLLKNFMFPFKILTEKLIEKALDDIVINKPKLCKPES